MQGVSRRFLTGWLLGVGLGLVLAATSGAIEPGASAEPAVSAAPPPTLTVVGTVKLETSDGTRVIQIVDAERRALIVDEVGAGRVLVKHAGERVSATGVVSLRRDGREVLEVSSFRPLGE